MTINRQETQEYPLAGLPVKLVLGATHCLELRRKRETALSFPESRWYLTVRGLSLVSFLDYPKYKTPSKQYENEPITYLCSEVITGLPRPYHNS